MKKCRDLRGTVLSNSRIKFHREEFCNVYIKVSYLTRPDKMSIRVLYKFKKKWPEKLHVHRRRFIRAYMEFEGKEIIKNVSRVLDKNQDALAINSAERQILRIIKLNYCLITLLQRKIDKLYTNLVKFEIIFFKFD